MSQQELLPEEPQGQYGASSEDEEIYQPPQPYTWSGKVGQEAMPRDEPPSSYDPTIMQDYQAGYRAQDEVPAASQQPPYQYNPYTDGDAQEQGYRPYNTYTYNNASNQNYQNNGQVPPWARPQERRYGPWRFGSILMILIFISILQGAFSHGGFFFFGHMFGMLLGAVLWPLFMIFIIFSIVMRRVIWGGRRRRGPWWW